jgi:hypothetical protein
MMYKIVFSLLLAWTAVKGQPTSSRQGDPSLHRVVSPASHLHDADYSIKDPFNAHHDDYINMLTGTPPYRVKLAIAMRQRGHHQVDTDQIVPKDLSDLAQGHTQHDATSQLARSTQTRVGHPDKILKSRREYMNKMDWQRKFDSFELAKIFQSIQSQWGTKYGKKAYKMAKQRLPLYLNEKIAEKILRGHQLTIKNIARISKPKSGASTVFKMKLGAKERKEKNY